MVLAIQQKFTPEELAASGGGDKFFVSEGWHETMVTSLEMVDSFTEGNPQDLVIHGVITTGKYAHVEPNIRLSINDDSLSPSGKISWSKMAHISLNKIAQAAGFPTVPYADLEQLRNRKIMVKYVTKKGGEKKDENGFPTGEHWEDNSQARDYKAVPAVAVAPVAAPQAAPAPASAPAFVPPAPVVAAPAPVAAAPVPAPAPAVQPAIDDSIPF